MPPLDAVYFAIEITQCTCRRLISKQLEPRTELQGETIFKDKSTAMNSAMVGEQFDEWMKRHEMRHLSVLSDQPPPPPPPP